MLKIGDKIMYGAGGVMTIVDIREESISDVSRSYYVLRPTLSKTESLTFVPTDNELLVSAMRPLLTKEEILELISFSRTAEPCQWVNENRARQDRFKKIMESGDRRQIISMIRAIDASERRRESEGKKIFLSDDNARTKALKLLYSEISVVFDMPEEEVKVFVNKELTK